MSYTLKRKDITDGLDVGQTYTLEWLLEFLSPMNTEEIEVLLRTLMIGDILKVKLDVYGTHTEFQFQRVPMLNSYICVGLMMGHRS